MKKTFNVALLGLVATVLSASAFANGPCKNITTILQCDNYFTGECRWDAQDQRCENKGNTEDPCNVLNNLKQCASEKECFWDSDDKRCESREAKGGKS